MSIIAVRPLQSRYPIEQTALPRKAPKSASANRNTGPDTVSLSEEALALSKAALTEKTTLSAAQQSSADTENAKSLPEWFAKLLPAGLRNSQDALPGLNEVLDGSAFASKGLSEQEREYCEGLVRKFREVMTAQGVSASDGVSLSGTSAFGKIFQRELFKALESDPRFVHALKRP